MKHTKRSSKHILGWIPSNCTGHLNWALNVGRYDDPQWYSDMINTCGVSLENATLNDFQRFFKCRGYEQSAAVQTDCIDQGLQFPTVCSCPPCDQCTPSCQG